MTEKRVNVLQVEDYPLHAKLVPRLIEGNALLAHNVLIVVLTSVRGVMLARLQAHSATRDCG